MMYRPNAAQRPRTEHAKALAAGSFATMAQSAVLSFLTTLGIYEVAQRENNARTRRIKRDSKLAGYRANGLNGPRAMARRARQWERKEAKALAFLARYLESTTHQRIEGTFAA